MKIKFDIDGISGPPEHLCSTGAEIALIAAAAVTAASSLIPMFAGGGSQQTFQAPAIPMPNMTPLPPAQNIDPNIKEPQPEKPASQTGQDGLPNVGSFGDLAKSGFSTLQPLPPGTTYKSQVKDRDTGLTKYAQVFDSDINRMLSTKRREGWSNLISF